MTNGSYDQAMAQAIAEKAQAYDQSQCGAALGKRDGLMHRIRASIEEFDSQRTKVDSLHELEYLLNKNPEVARILELVRDTGIV